MRAAGDDTVTLLILKPAKRRTQSLQGEMVEFTAHSDRPRIPQPLIPAPGKKWMVTALLPRAAAGTAMGFTGVSVVKKAPSNMGDTGDAGLIPGLGRSPGKEKATHSSVLAWKIPRTEEPGGLQSAGSQSQTHLSD